jgi:hypothetical protein
MALRLLLLTGARASEVCGGRFDERLLRLPRSNELKLTFRLRRATMVKWLPREARTASAIRAGRSTTV